jgi:NAD(P)-dependent dehydrogenase (short-subunit alcohol dehydrogenase family)
MNKTWLITGVSSGFGKLLAEKALIRGDRVVGTGRSTDALSDLRTRYPERLRIAALDLKDLGSVRGTVDGAFRAFGRIDVIVSNAGYGVLGAAEETTDAQLRDIVETNLLGSIALIRAVLLHLRHQGGGKILQVSSEGGQLAYPGFGLYHATKWGIEGFVEAVTQEVAGFDIGFTLIEPGPARTDFGGNLVQPEPLAAYAGTPAHQTREAALGGGWVIKGDPDRMTDAMIRLVDQEGPLPRRLVLGADAYARVRAALTRRVEELDNQRAIALSADYTDDELARL